VFRFRSVPHTREREKLPHLSAPPPHVRSSLSPIAHVEHHDGVNLGRGHPASAHDGEESHHLSGTGGGGGTERCAGWKGRDG
jgi:hypothetical protein